MLPLFYTYYLEFCREELSLLLHSFFPSSLSLSFFPSFSSLYQYGCFMLWIIVQYYYFVDQIHVLALVIRSLFRFASCSLLLMTQSHLYILDFFCSVMQGLGFVPKLKSCLVAKLFGILYLLFSALFLRFSLYFGC